MVNAVHHARVINREIRLAQAMDKSELYSYAKQLQVPVDLLAQTAKLGRLPVVNFAAGGLGKRFFIEMFGCAILGPCFVVTCPHPLLLIMMKPLEKEEGGFSARFK